VGQTSQPDLWGEENPPPLRLGIHDVSGETESRGGGPIFSYSSPGETAEGGCSTQMVKAALQSSALMEERDPNQRDSRLENSPRGRLKVFLGYASGVGKSFRMFDEARRRKERGQDVVVGALQPEIPQEINPLLASLEIVPTLDVRGVPVIDVPAIIRRQPQVCIVDGLAYDNPWGRHAYRWQDVEELLTAGINVVGSVNLQHIGDHREAVEKLTGQKVKETIPRKFLNTADEIVVVDAPTEGAPPELS